MPLTITINEAAPGTLTIGVGTPGVGVAAGGTTGQVLQKLSGVNYDTGWATPSADYITAVTAPLSVTSGNLSVNLSTYLPLAGGTMNANANVDLSDTVTGTVSEVGGYGFAVSSASNINLKTNVLFDRVLVAGAVSATTIKPTGVEFPDLTLQTTAGISAATAAATYYPLVGNPSGFLTSAPVTSVAGMTGAVVLSNTDISGLGTMATATAANYSTTAVANGLYYPLAGNPSSFLVAADITGKANLASPSFTGNVSITSSSGAALFIEQTGTGNILTLHDQASDTTFVTIDANGKVSTIASEATNGAGFNIAHGAAPTSPVNGDIWTTTAGLFARISGSTKTYANLNDNNVFTNANSTYGNSTGTGTTSLASGSTISASTKTVNVATGGVSGSTTLTTIGPVLGASTTSIGNTTAASTLNLATGATLTATAKAVNIGTSGVAGSTTNIAIGSTTGTSTTTLQGTTNGITDAVDTNSVALATTAFVVGQASSTTPAATGTAAIGTSLKYARADHVHVNPLPSGGTTGQVLSKVDGTSYNVAWTTPSGGGYITSVSSPLSVTSNNLTVDLSTYLPLAGGTMAGYLYSNIGNGMDSVMTEGSFKVKNTSTPTSFGELTAIALRIANATGQMQIGPDMITFPDATTQASAGYPLSGNPSGFVTDAPSDSNYYSRYNGTWSVPSFGVPEAPNDGLLYARNNLNWTAFTAGMSAPGYSNAVWYGGAWYSANVTSLTDGYGNYYNALTL